MIQCVFCGSSISSRHPAYHDCGAFGSASDNELLRRSKSNVLNWGKYVAMWRADVTRLEESRVQMLSRHLGTYTHRYGCHEKKR
jgi:hypothetical protein